MDVIDTLAGSVAIGALDPGPHSPCTGSPSSTAQATHTSWSAHAVGRACRRFDAFRRRTVGETEARHVRLLSDIDLSTRMKFGHSVELAPLERVHPGVRSRVAGGSTR